MLVDLVWRREKMVVEEDGQDEGVWRNEVVGGRVLNFVADVLVGAVLLDGEEGPTNS